MYTNNLLYNYDYDTCKKPFTLNKPVRGSKLVTTDLD